MSGQMFPRRVIFKCFCLAVCKNSVQCMGAFADLHHIKFRFDTGFFRIGFVQRLNKQVYGIIFYDTDRTSAESAAGDTGAKDARYVPCQLRQKIRLCTGSLIIVPQRDVGIIDEAREVFATRMKGKTG